MVTEEELQNMSPEEVAEIQKNNCIFCKIIDGEVPGKKVYEDDKVLAILDIRPASEGHVLIMPKEHYPILPLVPRDVQKHMFRTTKRLVDAVKAGVPATSATIFIANGAAAGQQSPHFLYHVIARDAGDGLDMFRLPEQNIGQEEILQPLQQAIGRVMQSILVEEGKLPPEAARDTSKNQLATLLQQNPDVREMLINETEKFKEVVAQNPQLQQVFQGVDIDELAEQLGTDEIPSGPPPQVMQKPAEEADEGQDEAGQKESNDDEKQADLDKVSRLFK